MSELIPDQDDVKALLAHFRLAAYRSGRARDLRSAFPEVFGGYLRRARRTSMGEERVRLAYGLYEAAARTTRATDRRALAAVGWRYGLFGPPRDWSQIKLPASGNPSPAGLTVSGDSLRRTHQEAFSLLAHVLPPDPADPKAHGETYPQTPTPLDELDVVSALAAVDPRLDRDLARLLTSLEASRASGDAKLATTVTVLSTVPTRETDVPPPLPPHDVGDLAKLEESDRELAAAAHRHETLDSEDVAELITVGDRWWGDAQRSDNPTAQLCYAGALMQTALHRAGADDREDAWSDLERRALTRSIDTLRSVEYPAAHLLERRLAKISPTDIDARTAAAINLSIVSSAHRRYQLGLMYLKEARDLVKDEAPNERTGTEWLQQLELAESGVLLRLLRDRPVKASSVREHALTGAYRAASTAARNELPWGWHIAARRRQLEVAGATLELGLGVDDDWLAHVTTLLDNDHDAAATVDPWWDLQQRKATLQLELVLPRPRFDDAAATLEYISERYRGHLSRHRRWILDLWEAAAYLEQCAPSALSRVRLDLPDLPNLDTHEPEYRHARLERLRRFIA